jgi:hypothetical protein
MAAFNFLMLPAYYGEQNLGIPGLGMLILGLQLESWACIDLLAVRERRAAGHPACKGRRNGSVATPKPLGEGMSCTMCNAFYPIRPLCAETL